MRLSRISACGSLASPCTTLIRSNTTRRSAPMTRSRLRSPTSKSTTTTFWPCCASAAPSAAVEVVLPTPPFPDVTTRTLAILLLSSVQSSVANIIASPASQACTGLPRSVGVHVVGGLVDAVDRQQFGFQPAAEDARAVVAGEAGDRPAAQRAVDMDRAAGDHLGARGDRADDASRRPSRTRSTGRSAPADRSAATCASLRA